MLRLHLFVLLGLLAAATASSVNLSLEELLRADISTEAPPSRERSAEPPTPLDGARLAQLCALPLKREASLLEATLQLDAELLGTLYASDPRWSLALVEREARVRTVAVGDAVGAFTVTEVGRGYLMLEYDGRTEKLTRRSVGAAARPGSGVTRLPDRGYEVSRRLIDPAGPHAHELFQQARFVPAFLDGKPVGFKLQALAAGSIYEQLGAKAGDLIRSINGYPLDRPEKLYELYTQLQTATRFEVELERDGTRQLLSYRLRDN
jgi:general secretion pathway protein C